MTANAADFAGSGCGRRYEKELETHFRDCLLFYLDGRIRFERYCYGEAACLVFSVWAHGFDADGNILWDHQQHFCGQKHHRQPARTRQQKRQHIPGQHVGAAVGVHALLHQAVGPQQGIALAADQHSRNAADQP